MKQFTLFLTIFSASIIYSQNSVVTLNPIANLLNEKAKKELNEEIKEKDMVFLGESEHHIGSDFVAKTEFVKFLVLEHNYKNIVFESDFFALYFTHDKNNLFPHWSKALQCKDLFQFLETNNVTIWGFDNQFSSGFSFYGFTPKLFSFLDEHNIPYDLNFKKCVEIVCTKGTEFKKLLSREEIAILTTTINNLCQNEFVIKEETWLQFLASFKSLILMDLSPKIEAYTIRDHQMASNLNFLANKLEGQKIIVWAANIHISKLNQEFMDGKTMGANFIKQSNRKTYHIAFAPIKMPYRKSGFITSQAKKPNNLLSLLPDNRGNAIIFSNAIDLVIPRIKNKKFKGMFGMGSSEFNYFAHFDALVFIGNGEKARFYND